MLNHKYLKCLSCGAEIVDDGLVTGHEGCAALLRARYTDECFKTVNAEGLFAYSQWLPIDRILSGSSAPVTYQSKHLSMELGLDNLFVTFSGYWEEKSVYMDTCSFKECEAYAVLARFPIDSGNILVVASAGNTARAFIKVASENNIRLVVVIPEKNLSNLWRREKSDGVCIVAAGGDSDYSDAIALAGTLCERPGFTSEGGAKNVARRDGMGTVMLSAANYIGNAPDYYFQAVGSGTGAIAAWEANQRLLESGAAGKTASLQLSQNKPFLPIYQAWKNKSRKIIIQSEQEAKAQIDQIAANVLSNRTPPYEICGGLYDALTATSGDMWAVTNDEIAAAQALFLKTEGCDICPEAGAALASVMQAIESNRVKKQDVILLNITGGGYKTILKQNKAAPPIKADIIVPHENIRNIKEIDTLALKIIENR